MTDANGGKGADGEAKKDDTIVKVAGAAIAAGIAFSLYKSLFVGKKKEHPVGESSHDQICIQKPDELQKLEEGAKDKGWRFNAGAKEKSRQFKAGAEEAKDDVGGKASDVKGAIAKKGQETKDWFSGAAEKVKGGVQEGTEKAKRGAEDDTESVKEGVESGKESAAEKTEETKKNFFDFFNWGKKEASKEKEEIAYEADKVKDGAKSAVEGGKKSAEETESKLLEKADEGKKDAGRKDRGFFAKTGSELQKGTREVGKVLSAAEQNVEKGAAAVVNKVTHPLGGGKPKSKSFGKEYRILRGDTLWDISKRHGVSIEELKVANSIWDADFIVAGDTLTIPK